MTRNLPQALLTLALVFATGLLVGVGGSSLYYQKTQEVPATPPDKANPDGPKPEDRRRSESVAHTLRNLKKYLDITDGQEEAIRGELETADQAFRAIFEKIRPEVEKTRDDRAAAIVKHLTPEQAVVFNEKRPDLRKFGPSRGRRGPFSPEGFRSWVASMDKNKDGLVAADEIEERHRKNFLGYFDDNKDGLIDAAELKKDRPPPARPEGDWGRGRGDRRDRGDRGGSGDRDRSDGAAGGKDKDDGCCDSCSGSCSCG